MRTRLTRPWTEEDTAHLTELQARGVSATRAALALKRPKAQIVVRARQMGIPFPSLLELRKREKEIGASPMASRASRMS